MSVKKDSKWKKIVFHLILIISVIIALYPALRVFGTSLRPDDALHSKSLRIIPPNATFKAYRELIFEKDFLIWLRNSLLVTFFTVTIGVSLAATAGYVFSRKRFPGRKSGLTFFLVTQMFPATMLLLPMYLLLSQFGLTQQTIVVPF